MCETPAAVNSRSPAERASPEAERPSLSRGFVAVIAFKWLKAVTFLVFGIAALRLARLHSIPSAVEIARFLSVSPENALVHRVADVLARSTPRQEVAVGVASLLVSGVFAVEGACLAARIWWSTYLTITLTALGIPLELYEIAQRPDSVRRYLLLGINLAILGYLWARRDEFKRYGLAGRRNPAES